MSGDTLLTESLGQLTSVPQPDELLPSEVQDLAVELVEQISEFVETGLVLDKDPYVLLDISVEDLRCVIFKDAPSHTLENSRSEFHLSPREREIARMIAEGYPNKTIAAVLEISSWTVNTHLRRMFAKCGVHSRAALIAKLLGVKSLNSL